MQYAIEGRELTPCSVREFRYRQSRGSWVINQLRLAFLASWVTSAVNDEMLPCVSRDLVEM